MGKRALLSALGFAMGVWTSVDSRSRVGEFVCSWASAVHDDLSGLQAQTELRHYPGILFLRLAQVYWSLPGIAYIAN